MSPRVTRVYVYVHAFSEACVELAMERFCIDSCVREYHVYSDIWGISVGEELPCEPEDGNSADSFAVTIKRSGVIIGHISRKISLWFALYFCGEME